MAELTIHAAFSNMASIKSSYLHAFAIAAIYDPFGWELINPGMEGTPSPGSTTLRHQTSSGNISGTVRQEGNVLANAVVCCSPDVPGQPIGANFGSRWRRTEADGTYSFSHLNENFKYKVIIYTPDNTLYQAVVFDNITPG